MSRMRAMLVLRAGRLSSELVTLLEHDPDLGVRRSMVVSDQKTHTASKRSSTQRFCEERFLVTIFRVC
jgi:hypothetical protein